MSAKSKTTRTKKPATKSTTTASSPTWSGPFYNHFSRFMPDDSAVPVSEWPILPETVVACLENLAAYEHQTTEKQVDQCPSKMAMRFLSRVLREDPIVMADAIKMQAGTTEEQLDQEAMYIARRIVVTTALMNGENVSFMPKCELLLAMKRCHPRLFNKIPQEKRGQAYWFARAKLKFLPQARRGGKISPQQKELVKMITSGFYPSEVKLGA